MPDPVPRLFPTMPRTRSAAKAAAVVLLRRAIRQSDGAAHRRSSAQKGFGVHFTTTIPGQVLRDIPARRPRLPSNGGGRSDDAAANACASPARSSGLSSFLEPIALYPDARSPRGEADGVMTTYPEPGHWIRLGEAGVHGRVSRRRSDARAALDCREEALPAAARQPAQVDHLAPGVRLPRVAPPPDARLKHPSRRRR